MRPSRSVEWVCEYKPCKTTFMRFPFQVRDGTHKFCSPDHAIYFRKENHKYIPREKKCETCDNKFEATSHSHRFCESCKRQRIVSRYLAHDLKKFNMAIDDYESLVKQQNGLCAICKRSLLPGGRIRRLSIDHDHRTGAVRGLLCTPCNTNLGWFEKWSDSISEYLAKAHQSSLV